MLDLIKIKMPSSIELGGFFYDIKTDFREWLKFSRLLKEGAPLDAFDVFYEDKIPKDKLAGFEKLSEFYNPPQELPRPIGKSSGVRVLDYDIDGALIYAAFYEVYKIDLLATDGHGHGLPLHWHKFLSLLSGLHNTRLNEIMSYRAYNQNDKRTSDQISRELKNAWALPEIETAAEKAAREEFNALFI